MPIIFPMTIVNLIMAGEKYTMVSALSSSEYSHILYAWWILIMTQKWTLE